MYYRSGIMAVTTLSLAGCAGRTPARAKPPAVSQTDPVTPTPLARASPNVFLRHRIAFREGCAFGFFNNPKDKSMNVIAAAIIVCAATFALTDVVLAQGAAISTTRSNIKRPQKTNQPIVTKDVDNINQARPTSRSNERSGNGPAVGDVSGDGVSSSRSAARNSGSATKSAKERSLIFDRWGKTR